MSTTTSAGDHLPRTSARAATDHTRSVTGRPCPTFDPADFGRAARGLVAQLPGGVVDGEFGRAWDASRYDFIEPGAANPDTVHPSLWRQA